MKLRAIRLQNVRRFIEPVEITGIGPGLNVLSAPNEHGKSTVFDALHAVFFKDRKSWDKEVRALAPHAGGDPEVGVEVEIDNCVYQIEKRWNKGRKGEARIIADGRLLKQADDAEAWLGEMLTAPKDGGPAGLLWVRQGVTGLDDGDAGRTARRDLLSSVAGEVEAMTGGRRMDAALARCRQELDAYVTRSGKAKANHPLKQAEDDVGALETQHKELATKAKQLDDELARRRSLRRQLEDLEDPKEEADRKERLAQAEAAAEEAARHADEVEKATNAERSCRLELDRAKEQLSTIEVAITEARNADAALTEAKGKSAEALERQQAAEAALADASRDHEEQRQKWQDASRVHQQALRASAAAAADDRRKELTGRLDEANKLRTALEEAGAEAQKGISPEDLEKFEALAQEVRIMSKARESEAAALTMHYAAGRDRGVALDGAPLPDGRRVAIPDGATLEIDGIGQLTVHPGSGADSDALTEAEDALAEALKAAGQDTLETARAAASYRAEALSRHRDAEAGLKAIAPDGIDDLREKLARLPEPVEADPDLPNAATAQKAEESARDFSDRAHEAYEQARAAVDLAKTTAARAAATEDGARDRADRARKAVGTLEDAEARKGQLEDNIRKFQVGFDEAARQREALASAAPDLDAARATLERAQSVVQRAEKERQDTRVELARLDTAIDMHAGEAVQEELADVEMRLESARQRLGEIEFEVAVLNRLDAALQSARETARDRYVEPVLKELEPLIRLLWPEAELRFDAEAVLPTALVRAGTEEDFDILSGGTQEQIALLVRLAFARMLARSGRPAPVILDDAIVHTDDERIERMFDALTRQAQDLQILVFSCRQKAFRDLGGGSLVIETAAEMRETA